MIALNSWTAKNAVRTFGLNCVPAHCAINSNAFSLGKPAVVTNVGGLVAEVAASGAGLVTVRGDLDELRDHIILLLKSEQMRAKYAQRAVQYVQQKIGWNYIAGMHQSIYSLVTRGRKSEASAHF